MALAATLVDFRTSVCANIIPRLDMDVVGLIRLPKYGPRPVYSIIQSRSSGAEWCIFHRILDIIT